VKRVLLWLWVPALVLVALPCTRAEEPRTLDIYFLDMVGGASTLIVTPLGESVLIDTGSLRPEHRDADRILKACDQAGLKQIDYLVTTHFHSDHFGAILEVAQRIPVKCFLDKGTRAPAGDGNSRQLQELYARYEQATKGNAKTLRAGDDIPLRNEPAGKLPSIRLHCVAAEKKVEGFDGDIDAPIEGVEMKPPDSTDNARSIALILTYGRFKFFAGGDITWNVEHHLAPLIRRLGPVDLYQVTHHGLDLSNNPVLLKALSPTVAVAMNGPRKGIQARTFQDLTALPGLQALYQIHYNTDQSSQYYNTRPEFIANPKAYAAEGAFIKASVDSQSDTFVIQRGANGPQNKFEVRQLPPDLSQCTRIEIRWSDPVLLFETKAGWNQHAGPELFTIDNHDPKGGCVVLSNGTVKFIRSEQELRQLRWK
jgi:competence protein ComEC